MRKKKSTQQLVGIESVTDSSVLTAGGELTFYLVQPTNLNVLPESGVRTRVTALLNVLKASEEMESSTTVTSRQKGASAQKRRSSASRFWYSAGSVILGLQKNSVMEKYWVRYSST